MAAPPTGTPGPGGRPVVYLHIGAAKSGTTFLQNVLWHNRDRLREHGVLYPGRDDAAHVRAAFDLRETFFRGASDPLVPGAWPDLVAQARAWPGTTLISQELFAPALRRHVARALDDLGFADVHLIFTVRDLARQIPAHWQEDVKNRFTTSFSDFTAALRRKDRNSVKVARLFWGLQDPIDVLGRWGEHLPAENVHLVTLPRPGAPRDLLWKRFCHVVGVPPESFDLGAPFANPSLGLPEAQLLRRLNASLDQATSDWHFYNDEVKHHLAQDVLGGRTDSPRIRLPAEDRVWAAEQAAETIRALREAGYDVTGDLEELRPSPSADGGRHPDDPDWAGIADAGGDVVEALLRRIADSEAELARLPAGVGTRKADQIELLRADITHLQNRIDRLHAGTAPLVRRAARALSERHPAAARLREAYWRLQSASPRDGAPGPRDTAPTAAEETKTR
ncbi:hypothetical protein ABTW95_26120 [Spirillospora sp. NPDC127506]